MIAEKFSSTIGVNRVKEDEEHSCDSQMTLGEEPKEAVQDVNSLYDSAMSHEPPQTAGCLQLLSHCEGERQEDGEKSLFKRSSKRRKQNNERVADADLD